MISLSIFLATKWKYYHNFFCNLNYFPLKSGELKIFAISVMLNDYPC
jgi:hypothetical protein